MQFSISVFLYTVLFLSCSALVLNKFGLLKITRKGDK